MSGNSGGDSYTLDMVNQFLVEVDGMTSGKQKIYIIAATNRVEVLDSAVKSRLTEVIDIPLPTKDERKELFHTKLLKHNFEFKGKHFTEDVITKTENLSGRDIDNFVKKLNEVVKDTPYSRIKNLRDNTGTRNLFFDVLKFSELDLIRTLKSKVPVEIQIPSNLKDYSSVIGYDNIKQKIDRQIEMIFDNDLRQLSDSFNVESQRGILLYGPPGNSKTKLAESVARTHNLYYIKVISKDLSASTTERYLQNLELIFSKALTLSKMCANPQGVLLFFDEVDSIASRLVLDSVTRGTLLTYLSDDTSEKGIRYKFSKVILMAATNFYDDLDEAVIRSGRIDTHCFMDNPTPENGVLLLKQTIINDEKVNDLDDTLLSTAYERLREKIINDKFSKQENEISRLANIHESYQNLYNQLQYEKSITFPSGADIVDLYKQLKNQALYEKSFSNNNIYITAETLAQIFD